MTLDDYLATGPAFEPPIVLAVLAHLESLGDVIVEPVSVGVLVKRSRTFVELRPMTRWEALWFVLPRAVEHPRITRRLRATASSTSHSVRVRTSDEIDGTVRDWLTEALLDSA